MNSQQEVREAAPGILAEIKKAKNILLHCHPAPDPDSVGSALAMRFALEQLGKKATVIKGDSEIDQAFAHFPGASDIVAKNFLEMDLSKFDLFIALDSARKEMVTRRGPVVFPSNMKVIAIDHHRDNDMYGHINLVIPSYPANAALLYDLFIEWGIKMDANIASNIFIGTYTDTGGLKYPGVTPHTYEMAADLARYIPSIANLVTTMENSNSPEFIKFEALAFDNVKVYNEVMAISGVKSDMLASKSIPLSCVRTSDISSYLLSVRDWQIAISAVEIGKNVTKFSLRSKDYNKHDVSKLAGALGGGGHRSASGLILNLPLDQAIAAVVAKAKDMYNLQTQ